jgi:hypothetical protein
MIRAAIYTRNSLVLVVFGYCLFLAEPADFPGLACPEASDTSEQQR